MAGNGKAHGGTHAARRAAQCEQVQRVMDQWGDVLPPHLAEAGRLRLLLHDKPMKIIGYRMGLSSPDTGAHNLIAQLLAWTPGTGSCPPRTGPFRRTPAATVDPDDDDSHMWYDRPDSTTWLATDADDDGAPLTR